MPAAGCILHAVALVHPCQPVESATGNLHIASSNDETMKHKCSVLLLQSELSSHFLGLTTLAKLQIDLRAWS